MENKEENSFKVVLSGIIFNPKKRRILIGRGENDPYVPKLTWMFPSGEAFPRDDLEETLKAKIKEKTGLEIENLGAVFARIHPEKKDLLLIYYLCEVIKGKEKPAGNLIELKWVSPEKLEKYFTTSFHPHLKEYIINLK